MARKVLVMGEVRDGSLRNVSFEAVAKSKTIAEGGEVVGLLIGDSVASFANELIHYGADRVVTVENDKLKSYTSDGYAQAAFKLYTLKKIQKVSFWTYGTW